jgi:hypothetical protein
MPPALAVTSIGISGAATWNAVRASSRLREFIVPSYLRDSMLCALRRAVAIMSRNFRYAENTIIFSWDYSFLRMDHSSKNATTRPES